MDYKINFNGEPERFLLQEIVARIDQMIELQGFVTVALSGGSTPAKLYRMLGGYSLSFEHVHFFLVDERFVAADHMDSNLKMLQTSLFNHIEIPRQNIYSVNTILPYQQAIAEYQKQIEGFLEQRGKSSFDIIILGLGEDGHTASVFSENSEDLLRWETVFGSKSRKYPHRRITLSLGFINKAVNIFLLIKGESKRAVLKRLIEGDGSIAASLIAKKAMIFTDINLEE